MTSDDALWHASPDALTEGRWMTVRGVKKWATVEDEIAAYEAKAARRAAARHRQLAALLAERNMPSVWWSRASAKDHRAKKRALERRAAA